MKVCNPRKHSHVVCKLREWCKLSSYLSSVKELSFKKKLIKRVALITFPAWASATQWTGTTSTDWFDSTNWDTNALPDVTAIINGAVPNSPIITLALGGSLDYATVGETSTGSLTIDGVGVSASTRLSTIIGNDSGSNGTIVVQNGAELGSSGASSGIQVGVSGDGALIVDGAGSKAGGIITLASNAGSNGTLNVLNGGLLNADITTAGDAGTATITIDGADSYIDNSGSNISLAKSAGSTGSLTITNGGRLHSLDAFIGGSGTSNILIDGINSSFEVDYDVFAAQNLGSNSSLSIKNGGQFINRSLTTVAGTSTISVDGIGSLLQGSVTLGSDAGGSGTLTVTNGATFNGNAESIGKSGAGSLTVNGTGSTYNSTWGTNLGENAGSNGIFLVQNGALAALRSLGVGDYGSGSMTIDGGNSLVTVSYYGSGSQAGSSGTINITNGGKLQLDDATISDSGTSTYLIDGAGSAFEAGGNISSANNPGSSANITVQNGGNFSCNAASLGSAATTNVLVDGTGSQFSALSILGQNVGGTGNVTVNNGGLLVGYIITIGELGTGTTIINGTGADGTASTIQGDWQITIGDGVGSNGSLSIQNGASGSCPTFLVGNSGTGVLTIKDLGSLLNSSTTSVGDASDGNGTLTIQSNGALTGDTLLVGNSGTGVMTIDGSGSAATIGTQAIVGSNTGSNGTLTLSNSGTMTNATTTIGNSGNGNVTVQDAGSSLNSTTTTIGNSAGGNGTLTIQSNGALTGDTLTVGSSGTGVMTIDGSGSSATIGTQAIVGSNTGSNGTLTITNAGAMTSTATTIGSSGTGTLTIKDAGSSLNSTTTTVGNNTDGNGTLTIQTNGSLTGDNMTVGALGIGSLIVDGAGSSLNVGVGAIVGDGAGSNGTFTIRNAATVSCPPTTVGNSGTGRLVIKDAGSSLTSISSLFVGMNAGSVGGLTAQNAGAGSAAEFRVAENVGSTGALNIGEEAGQPATAPGTLTGDVVFGNGAGTLYFNHTDGNYTFSNAANGQGRVIVRNGTTHFPNIKNYTGPTLIQGGTLIMDLAGSIQDSSGVDLTSGTLDVSAGDQTIQDLSGTGGTVNLGSSQLSVGTANSTTYAGAIIGTGNINKLGFGTLTLTGATSTYSGLTQLTAGAIGIGSNTALGTSTVTFNGGKVQFAAPGLVVGNGFSLASAGLSTMDLNNYSGTLSGVLAGTTSTFEVANTGATSQVLTLSGINTYQGTTVVGARSTLGLSGTGTVGNSDVQLTSATSVLDISGISSPTVTVTGMNGSQGTVHLGANALTVNVAASATFGGLIQDGGLNGGTGGGLIKDGSGEFILPNSNSYMGDTEIRDGILTIGHHQSLGGGTINFTGTGASTLRVLNALANEIPNPIHLSADGFIDTGAFEVSLGGNLSGTGFLTKIGTGILNLNGANTIASGGVINAGSVGIGDNQALGTGGFEFNMAGTVLRLNSPLTNVANSITLTTDGTINTNGFDATFSGQINGTGALIKNGNGRLELSNPNSPYSGPTQINAGELKINGSVANSDVTVGPGALLTGNATVKNLINNGTVKPGNSIGITKTEADYNNTNGTYNCEINAVGLGQSDFINVLGTATLGGTLKILPQPGDYSTEKTYHILKAGQPLNNSKFNTVTSTSALLSYTVVYDPNDVYLKVIQRPLSSLINKGNPGKVAEYIGTLSNIPEGSPLSNFLDSLAPLNEAEIYDVFNQLHPSVNGLISSAIAATELSRGDGLFVTSTMDRSLRRIKKRIKETTGESVTSDQLGLAFSQAQTPLKTGPGQPFQRRTDLSFHKTVQAAPQSVRTTVGGQVSGCNKAGAFLIKVPIGMTAPPSEQQGSRRMFMELWLVLTV